MYRPDISPNLIHFTKGADSDEAFENLCSIADSGILYGSSALIKGSYNCVCFSEAPIDLLPGGLVNPDYYSRYSPFGVMAEKTWLYELGGRPVIYESDNEFYDLPQSLRWRHVRYEPFGEHPIDFTWEREWRVMTDELGLTPEHFCFIVPDSNWAQALIDRHESRQDWEVHNYSLIFGKNMAEWYREAFPWSIITLN